MIAAMSRMMEEQKSKMATVKAMVTPRDGSRWTRTEAKEASTEEAAQKQKLVRKGGVMRDVPVRLSSRKTSPNHEVVWKSGTRALQNTPSTCEQ